MPGLAHASPPPNQVPHIQPGLKPTVVAALPYLLGVFVCWHNTLASSLLQAAWHGHCTLHIVLLTCMLSA